RNEVNVSDGTSQSARKNTASVRAEPIANSTTSSLRQARDHDMQRERSGRCGLASRLSLTETAARPNCLGPRVCTFRRAPDAQAVCCRRRRDHPLTPTQFVRHEPPLPVCWPRRSGDLPPPSRQGEKSTASQYQARQSGTEDGPWDGDTEREQLGAELSTRE